jgi:hypothetical protein
MLKDMSRDDRRWNEISNGDAKAEIEVGVQERET